MENLYMQEQNRRCSTNICPERVSACKKIIFAELKGTLHGRVTITMICVSSRYWILSCTQQAKYVIHNCYDCKKHRALPYPTPNPGSLPLERIELSMLFQIIGTDHAGLFCYRTKSKKESKAYNILVTCSVRRAVHWKLAGNLTS